jgi:signal transduction histidine kinase
VRLDGVLDRGWNSYMDKAAAGITPDPRPPSGSPAPARDLRDSLVGILGADSAAEALDALRNAALFDVPPTLVWIGADGALRALSPREAEPPAVRPKALAAGEIRQIRTSGGKALALGLPVGAGALIACDLSDVPPREEVVELVEAFARVAARELRSDAVAAELEAQRRRSEESEALHTLGLAAHRSLDPDEVLGLIARFARSLLGANYVTVHILEGERVATAASAGLRTARDPGASDPFAARVVSERRPLTGAEAEECFANPACFHVAEGMRTALGVPLSLFGQTFGALVVGYRRGCDLSPRDTRLALTLAGHAAVAINNAKLHRTIADRSAELEQAYAELRRSSEEKERFFASMSHELRTPLNAIVGYHSLLLDEIRGPLVDGQRAYLENADRATKTLLTLVNDVLDLSKIEAGKIDVNAIRMDVRAALDTLMATIRPLADSKSIDVLVEVEPGAEKLMTDPDRLHQILLNLLSNAVKFTDAGSVRVKVRRSDARDAIEIRVSDTGPGIPPEDHERVFQEFEQIHGPGSREGTGLGLAIARKLARRLGGDLSLESSPGTGSTFIIRLPPADPVAGTGIATAGGSIDHPRSTGEA